MKKFLLNILLLGAIFITLCGAIEIRMFDIPNEYIDKSDYLNNHGEEISTLVLGHSHAAMGFVPEILGDSVFNCATQGRHIYYDMMIVERYLSKMKNLKAIIWPVGLNFEFLRTYGDRSASIREHLFTKYMNITPPNQSAWPYWLSLYKDPGSITINLLLRPYKLHKNWQQDGWEHKFKYTKETWKKSLTMSQAFPKDDTDQEARQQNMPYFRKLARLAYQAGVKFYIVGLPCDKVYTNRIRTQDYNNREHLIAEMREENPDLIFVDYITDPRFDSANGDFYNPSHLSTSGAKKFSKIFRKEVLDNNL